MPPETEHAQTISWQEKYSWLFELTMPDRDEGTSDEIARSAPDVLCIA